MGVGVPFSEHAVSVYWFLYDSITTLLREHRANQHEHHTQQRQKQQQKQNQYHNHQEPPNKPDFEPAENTYRQEQARREAEARQYREQQRQANEKHKTQKNEQAQNRGNQAQQEPPPRQPTKAPIKAPENRTYEQILDLPPHWTQEDLKTAYKREAGRTHPDRWIGKPEIIIQEMEKEYKAIQEAYRRLKK